MEKEPRKYTLDDVLPPRTFDDVMDFADEDEAVAFWEKEIDALFERLYAKIGRTLTEEEYNGVLGVVDELSPKDGDGYICGPFFSFDRAWQIYQYRKERQGRH